MMRWQARGYQTEKAASRRNVSLFGAAVATSGVAFHVDAVDAETKMIALCVANHEDGKDHDSATTRVLVEVKSEQSALDIGRLLWSSVGGPWEHQRRSLDEADELRKYPASFEDLPRVWPSEKFADGAQLLQGFLRRKEAHQLCEALVLKLMNYFDAKVIAFHSVPYPLRYVLSPEPTKKRKLEKKGLPKFDDQQAGRWIRHLRELHVPEYKIATLGHYILWVTINLYEPNKPLRQTIRQAIKHTLNPDNRSRAVEIDSEAKRRATVANVVAMPFATTDKDYKRNLRPMSDFYASLKRLRKEVGGRATIVDPPLEEQYEDFEKWL